MATTTQSKAIRAIYNGQWDLADKIFGSFGVEHLEVAGRHFQYLNTGDTYSETIAIEIEDHYEYRPIGYPIVTCWGDLAEQAEQEHCEGVIRCGYCGEFTDMNCDDWRDVVCEHCERKVGGSSC